MVLDQVFCFSMLMCPARYNKQFLATTLTWTLVYLSAMFKTVYFAISISNQLFITAVKDSSPSVLHLQGIIEFPRVGFSYLQVLYFYFQPY